MIVSAAGNDSGQVTNYPGRLASVIAVSGTDQSDSLWVGSNVGVWNEIAAPASSMPLLGRYYCCDTPLVVDAGTSFASAAVAGAAAALRAMGPTWSAQEVRRRLAVGAVDLGPPGQDTKFGFGLLNVYASLSAAAPAPPSLSLSGPTSVAPGTTCTWEVSVDGGVAPYAFAWSAGYTPLTGGEFVSYEVVGYSPGQAFQLKVTVTGADLAPSTASMWVDVESSAPPCAM